MTKPVLTRNLPLYALLLLTGMMLAPLVAQPMLLADTDRDGQTTIADAEGRDTWTRARGALFLNNNDSDDNDRLPDNMDEIVNGEADLEDLAIVRLDGMPELSAGDALTIAVQPAALGNVRIFALLAEGHRPLDLYSSNNLPIEAIGSGAGELRIEGLTYANPAWDGIVHITLTVEMASGDIFTDSAELKVAPFILLSSLQHATEVYVREYPGKNDELLAGLRELVPQAGANLYVIPGDAPYRPNNIWLQDAVEIGYSEIPGKRINVALKANRNKSLDAFSRDLLLGPDYGWFQWGNYRPEFGEGEGGNSWLDWYGNLEVTPPAPGYPLGRIHYGVNGDASLNPEVVAMLDAQGVQGPSLSLDTGWLTIKHVDEMLGFVPASGDNPHAFKALVPDTGKFLELIAALKENGQGATPIFARYRENWTIDTVLADEALVAFNRNLQATRIEPNIARYIADLGIPEESIIRVPSYYDTDGSGIMPSMVNSLVLNGHFISPEPNGPVIGGKDALEETLRDLLGGLPLQVHFLNDWRYHTWSGNIHCGTNAKRNGFAQPWWVLAQ